MVFKLRPKSICQSLFVGKRLRKGHICEPTTIYYGNTFCDLPQQADDTNLSARIPGVITEKTLICNTNVSAPPGTITRVFAASGWSPLSLMG